MFSVCKITLLNLGGKLIELLKIRETIVQENPLQSAKTFYSLLGHISKDQTIQYLLTLVDDFLQVSQLNRYIITRDKGWET